MSLNDLILKFLLLKNPIKFNLSGLELILIKILFN
jgi:hypothetical protein